VTVWGVGTGVLAVAVTCGLWWTYFPHAKPVFEHALAARQGSARSCLARDMFSVLHFPMLCGVVAIAAATAEALAHPERALAADLRLGLGGGAALFVCGTAAVIWRATGQVWVWRCVLAVVAAVIVATVAALPWMTMAVLAVALVVICVIERRLPELQATFGAHL
jgi:low temperature requirement protein LtrA